MIVRDDGHAPALRCGEWAIVDTSAREPENDALVFYRSVWVDHRGEERVHEAIVRLGLMDRTKSRFPTVPEGVQMWSLRYGRVYWPGVGVVFSGDGPLTDTTLRENLVGRVVGVWRPV